MTTMTMAMTMMTDIFNFQNIWNFRGQGQGTGVEDRRQLQTVRQIDRWKDGWTDGLTDRAVFFHPKSSLDGLLKQYNDVCFDHRKDLCLS